MKKLQNNKQIILAILLGIIIFLSGILIGSPVRNNVRFVYILIDVLAIIYILEKGIKKEKIINDKMDIFILILCLSSCIPIIFGTYTSLSDSISFVLKYSSIFLAYLVTKDIVRNNKKVANYLIYVILFIGVILVILGIDRLTYHFFKPAVEFLGITNAYQGEIRLTSLFSYANSFAAMTACGIFLALGQSLKTNKTVIKGINQAIIFIFLVGLVLSLSRMMFLVMGIISIIYIFLNKGKEKKLEILENLISTGILAVIYSTIFMKLLASGNYIGIWVSFVGLALLSFTIALFFKYINIKLLKIQKRTFIKISIIGIIGVIIILIILIKTPENLVLFNTENSEKKVERHLSNIKGEEKYLFKFEIDATTIGNKENFQITVLERDEYWNDLKSTNIQFGNYRGNKEIELYTHADTTDIYLVFRAIESTDDTKLEIKNFEMNGKKVYLNYKFLPYDFVSKIENINFKTQSVIDRGTYIKDAFKLIKDNWLFGIGGDGWNYRYGEIQEYGYVSREVHSYPAQILLEFGIVRNYCLWWYFNNFIKAKL